MEKFQKLIDLGIDINSADMKSFRTNQYDDLSGEWSAPIITSWDEKTIHLHFPTAQIEPYWSTDRLLELVPKKININNETYFMDLTNEVNISNKTGMATAVYYICYRNDSKIFVNMQNDSLQQVLIDFLIYILTLIKVSQGQAGQAQPEAQPEQPEPQPEQHDETDNSGNE